MNIRIEQTHTISGTVMPPSSKSQTIRSLLIATMANGVSTIANVLESDDTTHARAVCVALGATVTAGNDLVVEGNGIPLNPLSRTLHSGDSGITTRFVLPMLGLREDSNNAMTLDCGLQMRQRPLRPLIDALNHLGMTVKSIRKNDSCPLSVSGALQGGTVTIDGTTSQYLSALLLSLPCAPQDSVIIVKNLNERPYVEMTTQWLDAQDIRYTWTHDDVTDTFAIAGGQRYRPSQKTIPGDFSSASYLIAAGVLLGGEVILQGLDMDDPQGDKRLVLILQEMGADIEAQTDRIIVRGGRSLKGMTIDCNDIPDLVPTLAVIGTQAAGTTYLTNVPQARLKETDRIHSMATELSKMGAMISEENDGLVVKQSILRGAEVQGYSDHRTIMALAVSGLVAQGATTIDTAEGISKTFPGFVEMMNRLGAVISRL